MRTRIFGWCGVVAAALLYWVVPVGTQGTLSNQVLQLLTRTNTFTGQNTFNNLRMANTAIPGDTVYRIYADTSGNLYFNGGLIAGAGGGVTPHNLLSTTHPDTAANAPLRGALIIGNSTPAWARVSLGANHTVLVSNGTDAAWGTDGSGLTGLVAANLTGALPAISGASLTNLNASNVTSGTLPLAQLSNIANAQIAAAAAIAYSKLNLSASIVNADIAAGAAIAYSKLTLTGSVVSNDLVNATIAFAKIGQNAATANQVIMWTGAAWSATTITQAVCTGCGTVTSVALTTPAIFSVGGSPVTTSGTLAVSLATESANTVWAGPTGGGPVTPTFRALVNADFPTSGVVAGSYPLVTVNAQGIITAGSATLASGTIVASTPWTFTQTWNNAGVTFTGILENITSTASAAGSLLLDLQVSASSKWNVDKSGNVTLVGNQNTGGGLSAFATAPSSTVALKAGLTAGTQALTTTQASGEVSGANLFDIAATWNNAGNTPTAFKLNITDTASNANSLLLDLQKSTVSQWKVTKSGATTQTGSATITPTTNQLVLGTTNTTTLNFAAPSSSVTLAFPNIAGSVGADFSCGNTGSGNQTCSPSAASANYHTYVGESTLAANSAIITFPVSFTSTTSYFCVANDVTTRANPVQMVPSAGNTATITNTTGATDVIQWFCAGN